MSSILKHTGRALFVTLTASAALTGAVARAAPAKIGLSAAPGYADLVDLGSAAPVVVVAKLGRISRAPKADASGIAPGTRRYLVRADVVRVLVAPGPLPPRIEYLWDAPQSAKPDVVNAAAILFLRPTTAPGRFALVSPRAQSVASPQSEALVTTILKDLRDPDLKGRRVTGITHAFTTEGSVPGERETQVFLRTEGGQPVSLVIDSKPGEAKSWTAALGDTIDPGAGPVPKNTLAWYDLACFLPKTLPDAATADIEPPLKAEAREDYSFVIRALGPCGRTGAEPIVTPTAAASE